MKTQKKKIEAWCDGSADPNPGKAGVGVYLRCGSHEKKIAEPIGTKVSAPRAELTAILYALKAIREKEREVFINTDSLYAVNVLSGKSEARSNLDLISSINDEIKKKKLDVSFQWVKGHSGIEPQEIAHSLASDGVTMQRRKDMR